MIECTWVYAYLAPFVALTMTPFGIAMMLIAGTIWNVKGTKFTKKLVMSLWVLAIGVVIALSGVGAGMDFINFCF